MTRDQFVQKYRYRWGGMVLYGLTDDPASTALTRTTRLMHAPVEIDRLLTVMYDELRQMLLAELQEQRVAESPKPGPAPRKN